MMTSKMTSKKCRKQGQVTLEYFILFAVFVAATIGALTVYSADIKNALVQFFNGAAHAIDH